jgi:hypothetical protein
MGRAASLGPLGVLIGLLASQAVRASDWTPVPQFAGLTIRALDSYFVQGPGHIALPVNVGTDGAGVFEGGPPVWGQSNEGLTNLRVSSLASIFYEPPGCPQPCGSVLHASIAGTLGGGVFIQKEAAWEPLNGGLEDLSVTALAAHSQLPDFVYSATSSGRLFRLSSFEANPTWKPLGNALDGGLVTCFTLSGPPPISVYAGTSAGIFKTSDDGSTWSRVFASEGRPITLLAGAGQIWAGVASEASPIAAGSRGSLLLSRDGGATWETIVPEMPAPLSFSVTDHGIFLGTTDGVFQSLDGGLHWWPAGLRGHMVTSLVQSGQAGIFAGTVGAGLYQHDLTGDSCSFGGASLCLGGSRFRVDVSWTAASIGQSGVGIPMPLTADSGAFWFFQPSNIELVVKVLDGRTVNGHFWVFYGALSDVGYTITVTDTVTGQSKTYTNPEHTLASRADTEAF